MFAYAKPESKQKVKSSSTVQRQQEKEPTRPNLTGIPDTTKSQFENLSGFSFDDVRVHYNSDKLAQLQALVYTQGNQFYVTPGQEKHLEPEHVIQQKQGRVIPTVNISGLQLNDEPTLEREADNKVMQQKIALNSKDTTQVIQAQIIPLAEGESQLEANCIDDIIVYPGIDSCLGITIAINDGEIHKLMGIHLVMPVDESPDKYYTQLKGLIDAFRACGASEGTYFVNISASDTDIIGNIYTHLSVIPEEYDKKADISDWLELLFVAHNGSDHKWEHTRYDTRSTDYRSPFSNYVQDQRYLNVPKFLP